MRPLPGGRSPTGHALHFCHTRPMADSGTPPRESLADLRAFLSASPAFRGLDDGRLDTLLGEAQLAYVLEGDAVPAELAARPLVVQRGSLLVRDPRGRTTDLVAPGEFHAPAADAAIEATADTLLLLLPDAAVDAAWSAIPTRLASTAEPAPQRWEALGAPVSAVMSHDPATIDTEATCRTAATTMRDRRISALVVTGGPELAIVTDRDMRNRLVANGRSPDDPVRTIATKPVHTIAANTPVLDVLVTMLDEGIHHLPVTRGDRIVGMVTSGDLLQLEGRSPLHLHKAIDRATDVAELAAAKAGLPSTIRDLLAGGTPALAATRIITTVTDRIVTRLIDLAIEELGAPPCPFGWLAFGSQARREQTLHTDQDTGLVIADGADPDAMAWFTELATRVTDGLERCGYPRCRGGVMASEPAWRRDVTDWRQRYAGWIEQPSEKALLDAEIAFDVRTVAGELAATDVLAPVLGRASDNHVFLGRLARVATGHRPPLGFLGGITVERSGEHAGTFDVKRGGMLPIVDIARLLCLSAGASEVGTVDRLDAVAAAGLMSPDLRDSLAAGYELLTELRLQHHVRRLTADAPADNNLRPDDLPPMVRSQLKATFKAIRTAQELLDQRYLTSQLA